MTPEERALEEQAEALRKEQEELLREREELEKSNADMSGDAPDLSETQQMLQTIKDDIQGIHNDNEKLKREIQALGAENVLLKQAVSLPEGAEGEQVLKNTVAGLEAMSVPRPSSTGSNVIWQTDVKHQREELRGEREELLTERARLREEAARLCNDLQANVKKKYPERTAEPLAGVLEEYGGLCAEATDLQAEHEMLKKELEAAKAQHDPAEEKKEADMLRRQLTAEMIRYTFFPPKAEVVPAPKVRLSEEVKENNQFLKFKTKDMLGQLLKAQKPGRF
eukprot:gnl/MRDRNA2_/MRDRNA2_100647_c0_seq1.p1 gnl/MRDRNA2_/MRDRNA2_100647_c0~~gnl/MRDRNA2_/MRDRNA2_100647_c0_seq1.p1  ORF type:complete len:280 (-),score=97.28 gnl/MRDRNA2_/MRDRNA2_100647_c0_seq1:43-882(-)